MFKRNFFKIYVLLWFITGCKISYKTYGFEKAPEIIKPDYSKSESWAVIPGKIPNTYVPGRNTVFIAIGLSLAEA